MRLACSCVANRTPKMLSVVNLVTLLRAFDNAVSLSQSVVRPARPGLHFLYSLQPARNHLCEGISQHSNKNFCLPQINAHTTDYSTVFWKQTVNVLYTTVNNKHWGSFQSIIVHWDPRSVAGFEHGLSSWKINSPVRNSFVFDLNVGDFLAVATVK